MNTMPPLRGSAKQIEWANTIRVNVHIYLQEYINDAQLRIDRARERGESEKDLAHYNCILKEEQERFDKLKQVTESRIYIDYFANYSRLETIETFLSKQKVPLTADQAKYIFEAHRARLTLMCMQDLMRCTAI
jgi:hypothetical protein